MTRHVWSGLTGPPDLLSVTLPLNEREFEVARRIAWDFDPFFNLPYSGVRAAVHFRVSAVPSVSNDERCHCVACLLVRAEPVRILRPQVEHVYRQDRSVSVRP